jgi:hypothetical protein
MDSAEGQRCCASDDVKSALRALEFAPHRIPAAEWPGDLAGLEQPGLYSWWIDDRGAGDLRSGLGLELRAGRIYAGQTGATKWPSGRVGSMTLRQRLGSNHLRGSIHGSTFRRTLAACLREPLRLVVTGPGKLARQAEDQLSTWMRAHLEVAIYPYPNRDALADLERHVLGSLDPPLNLEGMPSTPLRRRLSALRRELTTAPALRTHEAPPRRPTTTKAQDSVRVTLHAEIAAILRDRGTPMTTREIAEAVNARGVYPKRDNTPITPFQIQGRTRNYPQLFDRDGQSVILRAAQGSP